MFKGVRLFGDDVLVVRDDDFGDTAVKAFFLDNPKGLDLEGITTAGRVRDDVWIAKILLGDKLPEWKDASHLKVDIGKVNGDTIYYVHDGRYGDSLHEVALLPVELNTGPNGAQAKIASNIRLLSDRWIIPEDLEKPAMIKISGFDMISAWRLTATYEPGKGWNMKFKDISTRY